MGIAYDWIRGCPVVRPKKKRTMTTNIENDTWMTTNSSTNTTNVTSNTTTTSDTTWDVPPLPIAVGPLTTNLRHWHFSFQGCGIYATGLYHGRIVLPKDYPATPPRIQLWTPSGRFKPYHDICLSASAYHPETWTPRWTIVSLIQALRLHMLTNPQEIGGMVSTHDEILAYAQQSLSWKLSWKVGNQIIVRVDHARMIQQGAIRLMEGDTATVKDTFDLQQQKQQHQQNQEPQPAVEESNTDQPTQSNATVDEPRDDHVATDNEHEITQSEHAKMMNEQSKEEEIDTATRTLSEKEVECLQAKKSLKDINATLDHIAPTTSESPSSIVPPSSSPVSIYPATVKEASKIPLQEQHRGSQDVNVNAGTGTKKEISHRRSSSIGKGKGLTMRTSTPHQGERRAIATKRLKSTIFTRLGIRVLRSFLVTITSTILTLRSRMKFLSAILLMYLCWIR